MKLSYLLTMAAHIVAWHSYSNWQSKPFKVSVFVSDNRQSAYEKNVSRRLFRALKAAEHMVCQRQ